MSFWSKIDKPASEPIGAPAQPPRAEPFPAPTAAAPERPAPPAAPPAPPVAATPPAPVAREEPVAPAGNHLRLGLGVRLEGKLTFSGTVRIDATFQGSIQTDGVLVVGEGAKVDADITCGAVVVEGEVNGNVVAREAVELRRTAKVRGDVETPLLAVDRGARFDGASRRPAGLASASGGKAAAAPAASAH